MRYQLPFNLNLQYAFAIDGATVITDVIFCGGHPSKGGPAVDDQITQTSLRIIEWCLVFGWCNAPCTIKTAPN